MNPVLQEIIDLLDVERIEKNLYRGQNHQTEHVFGGQVLAQAIASAFRTVDAPHELHSIHAYFLRAGDWNTPILYEVDRIRDGRSFSTRRVVAIQHGRAIFNMSSSWHKREDGLVHALPMPDVPPPEALRGDREAYLALGMDGYAPKPIDQRALATEILNVTQDLDAAAGSGGGQGGRPVRDPVAAAPEA